MRKKIMSVFEISLACFMGFFAFYGMLCFLKTETEKTVDSGETKEITYNINYSKYNLNEDVGGLLVISGNGIVLKEIIDMFDGVEAIYISESIAGIESNAFRDTDELRTLVMPCAIYPDDMRLPMRTDLFFIEDNEYMEFLAEYICPLKHCE